MSSGGGSEERDDMKFFAERVDKDAIARLERFVSTDFAQVDWLHRCRHSKRQ